MLNVHLFVELSVKHLSPITRKGDEDIFSSPFLFYCFTVFDLKVGTDLLLFLS